jgi:hypothetical protein
MGGMTGEKRKRAGHVLATAGLVSLDTCVGDLASLDLCISPRQAHQPSWEIIRGRLLMQLHCG